MKIVIFGLSVSSSWGNGHAVLWRGLLRSLLREKHRITFFERDVPYYAAHRDLFVLPNGGELVLYPDWETVRPYAHQVLSNADVGLVTSYCPDGLPATGLVLDSNLPIRCFYDLDTPVTLNRLEAGEQVPYIGPTGLSDFDLVLSYTGGPALDALKNVLGARKVVPLYGSADPEYHRPTNPAPQYAAALSFLGTYASDRQDTLQRLLIQPAHLRPWHRFVIGGAQYPPDFAWCRNIFFVRHLPPAEHCAFYASSRLTLNVTRTAMSRFGWCPSGRLFEAAACGTPILSDTWPGLETFFTPGEEILLASRSEDTLSAIDMSDLALSQIGTRARERVLSSHTATHRARELIAILEACHTKIPEPQGT